MELFTLMIIIVLCVMPIAAALNIEIEKPLRNSGLRPENFPPKSPDGITVPPQQKFSISTPEEKKAA